MVTRLTFNSRDSWLQLPDDPKARSNTPLQSRCGCAQPCPVPSAAASQPTTGTYPRGSIGRVGREGWLTGGVALAPLESE